MRLVVIESPYRNSSYAEQRQNVIYARQAMHDALTRDEAPFASHLLYTQEGVLNDKLDRDRKLGIGAGFAWGITAFNATDEFAVCFYTDRGWSTGMLDAYNYYKGVGATVELRSIGGTPVPPPQSITSHEALAK